MYIEIVSTMPNSADPVNLKSLRKVSPPPVSKELLGGVDKNP